MATDPQRVERLTLAGSFCLFDKRLRSSGNSSIIWGLLNLLIGGALMARHDNWGLVSAFFGLALVAAGLYERTVRDPKVIIISAATLAVLAVWDFALIGLAAMGKVHLIAGGRTLFWAIAQAWGAYATWKTYSTYKTLMEKSDPVMVEQVRVYVDELKNSKPEQSPDLIQFEVNAGFTQGTKRYRLKPVEDFYLAVRYKAQLGSLSLEEINFVPRSQVTLTAEGEKWMSKKLKASVQLGPLKLDKVTITPDMAARMDPTARAISVGRT
jgi:uncharacterized membrane protein (UPF0136 family)